MNTTSKIMSALVCAALFCGTPVAVHAQDKAPEQDALVVDSGLNTSIQAALKKAKNGDSAGALKQLTPLVSKPNGGALAAYNMGLIQARQGDPVAAAKSYAQALNQNADFSPALINLARLYLRQNKVQDAEKIVKRYVGLRPRNLNHRAAELDILLAKKRYEDVQTSAKALLRKQQSHVPAMLALADANYALGRYELTKTVLSRALELSPGRADIFNKFGLVEMKLDNKRKAIVNFMEALKHDAFHPESNNNLGVLYHEARDYDNAIARYKAAVEGYPGYKEAYLNLGNSYKGKKDYKEAEKAFLKASSLDPSYPDALFNLGVLYLEAPIAGMEKVQRLNKSIETFEQYRSKSGGRLDKSDPTDKYVAEAQKAIKDEKARQELMRETPK